MPGSSPRLSAWVQSALAGGLRIVGLRRAENLARVRALARPYAPKDRLASEELIAERREEAAVEA
jgi:hypothetical protein